MQFRCQRICKKMQGLPPIASSPSGEAAVSQLKKYRKIKYLGKGSYGAAILVELRSEPSKRYVIKEIIIGHLKPAEQQAAKNEAGVLNQLSHSNITMYIESFVENSKLYIVMEFADGGDLSESIKSQKENGTRWTEEEIMRIFVQICLALKHVHDTNILHRDLKSQNIFLTVKGIIKLGDFGIAKVLDSTDDQACTQIGTPYYLSPEICESQPYGRQSDIWSLGVVLFEISALEMPFQANSLHALVHKICNYEPDYAAKIPYSSNLINLIKALLNKDPNKRPSLYEIVNSQYIKNHISKLLSHTIKHGTGGVSPNLNRPNELDNDQDDISPLGSNPNYNKNNNNNNNNNNNSNSNSNREKEEIQKMREDGRKQLRSFRENIIRKNSEGALPQTKADNFVVQLPPSQYNSHNSHNNHVNDRSQAVPSSGNSVGGHPQSRSLAELQQERMKSGNSNNDGNNYGNGYNNNYNNYNNQGTNNNANNSVVSRNGGSVANNSEFGRMEYFRNREAALAVKAKVEAYERNGSVGVSNLQQGSLAQKSSTNMQVDTYSDNQSAEDRIAMIKARKEKEREQLEAEKQKQLQEAHEANKQNRRDIATKKAIAFDVDLMQSDNNAGKVGVSNVNVRKSAVAIDLNVGNISNNSNSNKKDAGREKSVPGCASGADLGGHDNRVDRPDAVRKLRSISLDGEEGESRPNPAGKVGGAVGVTNGGNIGSSEVNSKRGWNIPTSGSEFQVPQVGLIQLDENGSAIIRTNSISSVSTGSSNSSRTVLEEKKKIVKDQAREIFRKLKDQKKSPKIGVVTGGAGAVAAQEKVSERVSLSDSKASKAIVGQSASSRVSPSGRDRQAQERQRQLAGVLSKVEEAKNSVQNLNFINKENKNYVIEKAESKTADVASDSNSSGLNHGQNSGVKQIELKDFDGYNGLMFPIEECYSDEEDLEKTLDNWLKSQENSAAPIASGSDSKGTDCDHKHGGEVNETIADGSSSTQALSEVQEDEEVLGLQCTLAKQLLL